MTNKLLLVEVSPEDAPAIEAIQKATIRRLEETRGVNQFLPEELVTAIAHDYLTEAIKHIVAQGGQPNTEATTNLFNLIHIGVETSDIDGEKDGNIVPFVEPGQEFKLMAKSDGTTEE